MLAVPPCGAIGIPKLFVGCSAANAKVAKLAAKAPAASAARTRDIILLLRHESSRIHHTLNRRTLLHYFQERTADVRSCRIKAVENVGFCRASRHLMKNKGDILQPRINIPVRITVVGTNTSV